MKVLRIFIELSYQIRVMYTALGGTMKFFFSICFLALVAQAQNSPVGIWLVGEKDAKIEIYKNGESLEGKIVWLKTPLNPDNSAKLDVKNPDEKLRSRALLGMVLLKDFKKEDAVAKWSGGTVYDGKSGKTYKGIINQKNTNNLELRGYVGISLFGRSDNWTRDDL